MFGLGNGISITLVFVAVLVFYQGELGALDGRFVRDFHVWRGVGYLVLYLWAFSLDIAVFEKFKINYQLLFGFMKMTPRSSFALTFASTFTLIYMVLFVFYLLDFTNLINAHSHVIYWFPVIIWGLLLGYLLNPLPIFNFKGRMFFFKQILLTAASPCVKIYFNIIFIT